MSDKQYLYKNNRMQQIKGFYYTVQKGGVSKAAEYMGLTQPTVSSQIKSLEDSLNIKLFSRKNRALSLTKNGKKFLKYVEPIVYKIDNLYEEFIDEYSDESSSIDISSNQISILHILPEILSRFSERNPKTKIMIRNISRREALELLDKGMTDVCLHPILNLPEKCDFLSYDQYDPVLIFRKDHPLAKKDKVTFEDVSSHKFLRIEPHLMTLPLFEEVVYSYGLGSNFKFENGDWQILKSLVRSGCGVALISTLGLNRNDPDIEYRSLTEYFPRMNYGFFTSKKSKKSQPLESFLDVAAEVIKERGCK